MTSSIISFACLHIFQTLISADLLQVFVNGKRHFHSFTEFCDTPKKSRGKNLIEVALKFFYLTINDVIP